MTTLLLFLANSSIARSTNEGTAAGCLMNLKSLVTALHQYAADHEGRMPANFDSGALLRTNWVSGNMANPSHSVNAEYLTNAAYTALAPYNQDPRIFKCPADMSTSRVDGRDVPRVRSYSMNGAVGTRHDGYTPTDGPWLDNNHGHFLGDTWRTYGTLQSMVDPPPGKLFVFIDEQEQSINDGYFAVGMEREEWIDWPATRHGGAAGLAFADGHVDMHLWVEPATVVIGGNVARRQAPGSVDIRWLQERTSALIEPWWARD